MNFLFDREQWLPEMVKKKIKNKKHMMYTWFVDKRRYDHIKQNTNFFHLFIMLTFQITYSVMQEAF